MGPLYPPGPTRRYVTVVFAAKGPHMSRIQEKITVVVGPARDISTAMIPMLK